MTTNRQSDRRVIQSAQREITTLLRALPEVAVEYREGMNREDDLREMLNTIMGCTDQIARQLGIEL